MPYLETIRAGLRPGALPGPAAQATMAPPGRGAFPEPPEHARVAAVMALFYHSDGDLRLLFIQRTSPPGDRHAGQISFPGGSADPGDLNAEDTALREVEEEIGIPRTEIEVLGALTPLYIPVSNFIVDPFAGLWRPKHDPGADAGAMLKLQVSEVKRVLTVPFADFLGEGARKVSNRVTPRGLALKNIPYYDVAGEEIWGATSMMVAELVEMVR